MKTFRQLQLHGSRAQMAALREELTKFVLTPAWRRNDTLPGSSAPDVIVFEYTGEEAPGAFVWLFDEHHGARVTNIVPKRAGSLSHDEYNTIAMRFAEDVLSPIAARISVAIELGAPEKSIEDLLPGPAAMALRHFSDSANRSTGAAHPLDGEKWDTFVILVHRAGISLAPDTLQRLLVEDEHWDDDQARELAIQYERALRLLESNDNFKAA